MSRHLVRVWAVVAGVVLAAVTASSQTPALRVVSAGPTGELTQLADADDVRIVFSEPMIDLGLVPSGTAPSWVHLMPAMPGTFYWSGTRTLMFSPDANTPLPNATTFTVRVDGSAASVTGRTLGAPHEFTFTTPTVRLLGADWYRKNGRFDQPAVIRLWFNQRVRPDDVLAHVRVALTPHAWTAPVMSANAREYLQRTDPAGLASFDRKVSETLRVTQASTAIGVRVATSWDEKRFWRVPHQVVLETTTPPPTDGWLNISIGAGMPSPEGPARHAAQSTVVRLEPTLFGTPMRCTKACDPLVSSGDAGFTQPVTVGALRRALSITDVTDPVAERPITPSRPLAPEREKQSAWGGLRGYDVGFDPQPPARTWRYRVTANLQSIDGQTLGYPRVEIVEHIHAQPSVQIAGGVWEPAGGSAIPIDARNVTAATVWSAPVSAAEIMPLLLRMQVPPPPFPSVAGERRAWSTVSPDITESRGEELRRLLSTQGTGLAHINVRPVEFLPGSAAIDPRVLDPVRSALVQVTNLGISVKDSPQSTLIFVTRLDHGAPVTDARVTLIDRTNTVRWRGATDRTGVALAPAMTLRDTSRPYDLAFIATAEKDGDLGFVTSNWNGPSPASWTWGVNAEIYNGRSILRGTVLTDRGVYKEQEEVHFKAILRDEVSGVLRAAEAGAEFDVRVLDARGREADRRTVTVNRWSSADWVWRVPADAALGRYGIQITRKGAVSRQNEARVDGDFLVAAYRQPNFRVDATLTADVPVLGTTLRGSVEAKYLFGADLGSMPVRWWFRRDIVQAPPKAVQDRFPEARYAIGYTPGTDSRRPPEPSMPSKTEALGANGRLAVTMPTKADGDLAYSYWLEGDVEDVAGQHIANRASLVVHPAALYVAFTRPSTFVDVRNGLKLGVLASDLSGNPVRNVPVTVSLFREQWVYAPQPGMGYYAWKREEIPAGEWVVTSAATDAPLTIPLRDGGCYIVRATARDANGRRTRTDATFYALGPGVSSWRNDGSQLDLTPERKTWKPGENARILIQSPWERATALVTVEREGIRHHQTFDVTSTQDTVSVPITATDVPNVHVSVLLLKGRTSEPLTPDGRDAGQPAYRLGYTELTVDDASKRLTVDVTTDKQEYRPRQPATVSVSVRTPDGAPATGEVTLWAVDYGVLSLTAYSVPDVVKALYPSQPLMVMTEDSRVAMMSRKRLVDRPGGPMPPAYAASPPPPPTGRYSTIAGLPQNALNINLDGVAVSQTASDSFVSQLPVGTRNTLDFVEFLPGVSAEDIRTDFRSLVFWAGSVTTDASGHATTTVTLPDSLTTYRIVAVAGDDRSRFGAGEREVRVTKPLTLLPEFPRFLSSGDRATFGAVVTNSSTQVGEATVEIQSLDPQTLQFSTTTRRNIRLRSGASESLRFDALAGASGSARVRLAVTMSGEVDAFEMPLVVTAPMRLETTAAYGDTVGTALERLSLPPVISSTAGGLDVELASTALVGLGESARYLTDYPFECAEQKASRALALLLSSELDGAFNLSGIEPATYRAEAERGLRALYGYQCSNGGFSLWTESCGSASAYLTAYVLHVLKAGDRLGVRADAEATRRALDYIQQQLNTPPPPEVNWRPVWGATQAYVVKVLAEYGRRPQQDLTRLVNEAERLPVFALSNLADALYGMEGDVWRTRYEDVVRRLTNALRIEADRVHVEEIDEAALSWLWNSNVRATAVVLDGVSRRGDAAPLVPGLVRWLVASRTNGRWATTHENAMALESLVTYYRAFEGEVPAMTATVKVGTAFLGTAAFNGRSTTSQQVRLSMSDLLKQLATGSSPTLTIAREGTGRAYYTARVRYLVPELPTPIDRGFHVERKYEPFPNSGKRPATTPFAKGDLVRVTVTLSLRGEGRFLALTDPLPAGFEPIEGWFNTTASDLARRATVINPGGDWLSAWRRGTFDHVEKRDDRVVGFATRLGSGKHEFTYLVRATTSGTFTAAGARVEAMYAPELTGKSAASTVTIK